jgi:hypothetical protein
MEMRKRDAFRYLFWVFISGLVMDVPRNPFAVFVLVPVFIIEVALVLAVAPRVWRAALADRMGQLVLQLRRGELRLPPHWVLRRLLAAAACRRQP